MAKMCFLLGVMPRSGTNYLSNVLTLHPDCVNCEPINEDFFVSHSNLLDEFTKRVANHWNPRWDQDKRLLTPAVLLQHLGIGLIDFIKQSQPDVSLSNDTLIVSKTPSTKNMEHFFSLFPDAKLLIVVRDGRAVVESGVKTFDWDFEKGLYDWNISIERINRFLESHKSYREQVSLVRYEDMLSNPEQTLETLVEFLGLSLSDIDVNDVKGLFVSGSSEARTSDGDMSWKHVKADKEFKPLERFAKWDSHKLSRSYWLAGQSLYEMGYLDEKPSFTWREKFIHYVLDVTWCFRVLPKTLKHLIQSKKLILKTY